MPQDTDTAPAAAVRSDGPGPDRPGLDRPGFDRTGPDRTGPDRAGSTEGRLPLVLSVGFTGHRTVDDAAAASRLIAAAFADLSTTLAALADMPLAHAYDGAPRLRLLAGGAPGADRLAQEAWRAGRHGELHAIYPFFDPASGGAATDDPAKQDPATRVDPGPEFGAWTGLDTLALGLEPEQGHAEVGRWLVRHADVLVAWWDGQAGQGVGGTNDTIRRALERGLPVVWLRPGWTQARLISLAGAHRQADATEAVADPEAVAAPMTPAALAEILAPGLAPPPETGPEADHADAAARRDYAKVDPTVPLPGLVGAVQRAADKSLWRAFKLFERVAGGARAPGRPRQPPPAALAAQPGFVRLSHATQAAAARADQLSNIHRSQQVLLILIATAAVFLGVVPALGWGLHVWFSACEFGLGLIAFAVTWAAQRAHRHRRWSDARRLTERLEAVLATWPLGFDIADAHLTPAYGWTEWRVLAVLRAAGPRRGWITRPRFEETVSWAAGELIDGQIDYHQRQHRTARNIERSLGWTENIAFMVLMGTLLAYLIIEGPGALAGKPAHHTTLDGFVMLVSAFAPAVAAGCLALEATNGFRELKERNARLAGAFAAEKARLGPIDGAAYHHVAQVMRRAAQLRVDDADAWRDRLLRRRIVRGA